MTTATAKDVKKSPIPKRILSRIDAAFDAQMNDADDNIAAVDLVKAHRKIQKDRSDVVAYIEDLIAKSAG